MGIAALAAQRAQSAAQKAQFQKQFVADKMSGAIGQDVTLEDYAADAADTKKDNADTGYSLAQD